MGLGSWMVKQLDTPDGDTTYFKTPMKVDDLKEFCSRMKFKQERHSAWDVQRYVPVRFFSQSMPTTQNLMLPFCSQVSLPKGSAEIPLCSCMPTTLSAPRDCRWVNMDSYGFLPKPRTRFTMVRHCTFSRTSTFGGTPHVSSIKECMLRTLSTFSSPQQHGVNFLLR